MPHLKPRTAIHGRSQSAADRLASGLGWVSIALGAAELFAPRALCRALGMEGHEKLAQAYGVREIATGVAILGSHDPTPWIWGRVGGDALDLATLVPALRGDNPQRNNVALALAAVVGITAIDAFCVQRLSAEKGDRHTAVADYSNRTGFPQGASSARGAALGHVTIPDDMRQLMPLRPYA